MNHLRCSKTVEHHPQLRCQNDLQSHQDLKNSRSGPHLRHQDHLMNHLRYSNRVIRWRLPRGGAISRQSRSSKWSTLAARMRVEWWSMAKKRNISMAVRIITTKRTFTRAWGRRGLQGWKTETSCKHT